MHRHGSTLYRAENLDVRNRHFGSPSDPQVLAEKEGAAEDGEQSTVNPNEVCSLLLTPAEEDLIDEGTRLLSSSPPSSRSDFGPFSALRPFDDADPRELASEGWDSDADWGFGGFEPCDSGMGGRDMGTPRRQKDSADAAAPLRRGKRQRDPWEKNRMLTWENLMLTCDFFQNAMLGKNRMLRKNRMSTWSTFS